MKNIRPIAIYLPQFHPIPENDKWWGKGFTEWTNVKKAKPVFKGHSQPHIPTDLGYYDLRNEEVSIAQVELAKQYGIYGFCYYHYWFNGKRLLEQPMDSLLNSDKPDFPFMICWANENWSRRWDGSENEILMAQNYSKQDAVNHSKTLLKHFLDKRYICIDNKPVFAIYKPYLIPNLEEYVSTIRAEAFQLGKLELFICGFDTGAALTELEIKQFDAFIEFQPQSPYLRQFMDKKIKEKIDNNNLRKLYNRILNKIGKGNIVQEYRYATQFRLDYAEYVDYVISNYKFPSRYELFPGVSPMWDNTARRGKNSFLFLNETPEKYGEWLSWHINNYKYKEHGNNYLFINAWNEWAEGNHLEPCQKWGRQYLEETRRQLNFHQL